jgi:putative ABC transport system ATP-binding protein
MLHLNGISKAFGSGTGRVSVLRNISLAIAGGSLCSIVGPSGSGKSTLLHIIGLLDQPDSGTMTLDGERTDRASAPAAAALRNRLLGFVFQSFHLLPRLSAWQNVALPLLYRGIAPDERRTLAQAMLERVGLGHRMDHLPRAMSGGQQQRVAIARALVGAPRMLLADEPTGSLDSGTAGEIFDLLRDLNRGSGITIVMVTHDEVLAGRCDRQIALLDGAVARDSGA